MGLNLKSKLIIIQSDCGCVDVHTAYKNEEIHVSGRKKMKSLLCDVNKITVALMHSDHVVLCVFMCLKLFDHCRKMC